MVKKNSRDEMDAEREPKVYDQWEDEPELWYDRFYQFCLYGSGRSMRRCYRDVMAEKEMLLRLASGSYEDSGSKARSQPKRDSVPGNWKQRAKQFDWWQRAKVWDADRRQRKGQRVEEALDRMSEASPKAAQFQIDLVDGKMKDADGSLIPVRDVRERRLASESILDRAGVVHEESQSGGGDDQPGVIGIVVHEAE